MEYNSTAFREAEQGRLVSALTRAESRGAAWILTNGSLEQIRTLFESYEIFKIPRHSTIAANPKSRRKILECVVLSKSESLAELRDHLGKQYEKVIS